MTFDEFVALLASKGCRPTGQDSQISALCPGHDDNRASLSVTEGDDDRILLNCFAGCSVESIAAKLGLTMADLFPKRSRAKLVSKRRIVATYDYTDENGTTLFQCVRYDPKDFKQRRPDPSSPDGWILNLKGVRRVPYRLPEVKRAIAEERTIYIAEGEKDCDALVNAGFVATCNPMGAGKWRPEHTDALRGAAGVTVIADKDDAGRKHARSVVTALLGVVKSVKLIELPDTNRRSVKDAADYFAAGGTGEQFRRIVEAAPVWTVGVPATPGQPGQPFVTPNGWFSGKFPSLVDEFGDPVLESKDKDGPVVAQDIGEDFLAATMGEKGTPAAPTVFVPVEDRFYTYSPNEGLYLCRPEPSLLTSLSKLILECARACAVGCDTKALEFRFRDSANLGGVLRKARGLLAVPPDYFSTGLTEFVPCANGMLRLSDKALLPFSPTYRRRNKLAVPFDAAATCPLFLETLMIPALDADDLGLIQRWCGLALIGVNMAQKMLLLVGTAGGGKGTLVRVINGTIGPANVASLRTQLLNERFELGRLLGKTLLCGADVPESFLNQRAASVLKSLTGGDPVTLEFKNSNDTPSIICRFNVVVTCNSRLTVHLEGDTDAWGRRLAIVEYNQPKPTKVIADLSERILAQEGSGVLNWALAGLDEIRAADWQLTLTGRQQTRVDDLLLESDGHAVFARECLTRDSNGHLTVADCFAAYVEFCTQRGWNALTKNKFGALIGDVLTRQLGVTIRHDIADETGKPQRGWRGVTVVGKVLQSAEKKVSELSGMQSSDILDGFPAGPEPKLVEEFL